jgi:hypothetical protein
VSHSNQSPVKSQGIPSKEDMLIRKLVGSLQTIENMIFFQIKSRFHFLKKNSQLQREAVEVGKPSEVIMRTDSTDFYLLSQIFNQKNFNLLLTNF